MAESNATIRKTVLWAINPFEHSTRPSAQDLSVLKAWAAGRFQIQPVYVFFAPTVDLPQGERSNWIRGYVPALESEIRQYLSALGPIPGELFREPKVLIQHVGGTREAVELLADYARDSGASWVLCSSKGESGLRRLALGSFAESLMIHSPVPVWILGSGKLEDVDPRRILFATDFSDESKKAFGRIVEQAAQVGASIRILHCVNLPPGMMAGAGIMGMSGPIPADLYLADEREWAEGIASDWVAQARARGVMADFKVKQMEPSIANAILFEAKAGRAGIIALASKSGPISAAVLGSHARQVIRQAECPVWVFGPGLEQVRASNVTAQASRGVAI